MAPTHSDGVRRLWTTLSALLMFLGMYLLNYQPVVRENAVLEAVVGAGLLAGVVGFLTYTWRYGLPPSSPES